MSFPLAPALFDNEDASENTNIEKKKSSKNKTLKKSKSHVAAIMDKIHETSDNASNESEGDMVDFTPPPPPASAGTERIETRNSTNTDEPKNSGDEAFTPESFTHIESTQVEDYYRNNVPYYTQMSEQPVANRSDLMKKMDKILHLLEEQQDHKTGHATEELILYSFVGVFIIFVVDSFARAGKYVR